MIEVGGLTRHRLPHLIDSARVTQQSTAFSRHSAASTCLPLHRAPGVTIYDLLLVRVPMSYMVDENHFRAMVAYPVTLHNTRAMRSDTHSFFACGVLVHWCHGD